MQWRNWEPNKNYALYFLALCACVMLFLYCNRLLKLLCIIFAFKFTMPLEGDVLVMFCVIVCKLILLKNDRVKSEIDTMLIFIIISLFLVLTVAKLLE